MSETAPNSPCVLVYASRERARSFRTRSVPSQARSHGHGPVRSRVHAAIRRESSTPWSWTSVRRAKRAGGRFARGDSPSTPFFGLRSVQNDRLRSLRAERDARVRDVLCEAVDEPSARDLVAPHAATPRASPGARSNRPRHSGSRATLSVRTWHAIVQHAGRPVTTRCSRRRSASRANISAGTSPGPTAPISSG